MMLFYLTILFSATISFITTFFLTKKFIVYLKNIGMIGYDINKKDKREVAEMGGPPVIFGFLLGLYIFIAFLVFGLSQRNVSDILASALTITTISFIAMFDDLTALMKKRGLKRKGLRQRHKFLLPLPAAIPLMAVKAGCSVVYLPLIGALNLGVLYPLFVIPIAIMGASNATNMLAGLNGLEAGLGIIAIFSLGVFALTHSQYITFAIAICFVASLLAFLYFNKYPAKIFPGDSLTYAIGATIAVLAILGNMEKYALFIFIPWFLEFFLKARTKFKGESFGKVDEKGNLKPIHGKIESLTHLPMVLFKNCSEKKAVYFLYLVEMVICLLGFVLLK